MMGSNIYLRSNLELKTKIVSIGNVLLVPFIQQATNKIGDIDGQNETLVAVVELKQNITFSDSIRCLQGNVKSAPPRAPIIRQVYEMSNNRSLTIPVVPEDPAYAVFLPTTDFNLTNEELRRGTVELAFEFGHDAKKISKISVWIKTPSGFVSLDKMKLINPLSGQAEPHILDEPFKNSIVYRVPIHCISKKQNQFLVEIEYKNEEIEGIINRYRTLNREKYIVHFQAHFENRDPYLNIADHSFFNCSSGNFNNFVKIDFEEISKIFEIFEDFHDTIFQGVNENSYFLKETNSLTAPSLISEEIITCSIGVNPNIYFNKESDNLYISQLGG